MAEYKQIGSISIVTDSETHYDNIGDVDGGFSETELKNHIEKYGHAQIIERLASMNWQVWETVRQINQEKDKENFVCATENLRPIDN